MISGATGTILVKIFLFLYLLKETCYRTRLLISWNPKFYTEGTANKCSGWPRQKCRRNNRCSLLYLRSCLFPLFSVFKCFLYTKCHGSAHLKIKDYQRSSFESFHSWKEIKITTKSNIYYYSDRNHSENAKRKKYTQYLIGCFAFLYFGGEFIKRFVFEELVINSHILISWCTLSQPHLYWIAK